MLTNTELTKEDILELLCVKNESPRCMLFSEILKFRGDAPLVNRELTLAEIKSGVDICMELALTRSAVDYSTSVETRDQAVTVRSSKRNHSINMIAALSGVWENARNCSGRFRDS